MLREFVGVVRRLNDVLRALDGDVQLRLDIQVHACGGGRTLLIKIIVLAGMGGDFNHRSLGVEQRQFSWLLGLRRAQALH